MEYRKLPHGEEYIGVLGVGTGGIHKNSDEEIEKIIRTAIEHGVNFFDLCAGAENVYKPFGNAIRDCRDKVYFQLHFGAVYNEKGEYAWSRDMDRIRKTFNWEIEQLGVDYVDFGFLHCIDENKDFDELIAVGALDYIKGLKAEGKIRHIGFSSHTPFVAQRVLDTGLIDLMMFSINPAYRKRSGKQPTNFWNTGVFAA